MENNIQSVWSWRFFNWYLRIWIPVILVLGAGLWLLYRIEADAQLASVRLAEKNIIQLASDTIQTELTAIENDVLYLAEHSTLKHLVNSGKEPVQKLLAKNMLGFAEYSRRYDHIHYLDRRGREVIRIEWQGDRPELVPQSSLQDKRDRYYVSATLGLKRRAVYISPFDLNVENNVIEQPIKPVIRVGTPVFDAQGKKRGLIVLNYRGDLLLKKLRAISSEYGIDLWMLNEEGYWLLGPRPEDEWGFMYATRSERRFDTEYTSVWAARDAERQGIQTIHENGMFSLAYFTPVQDTSRRFAERWLLVAHLSQAQLAGKMADRKQLLIIEFVVLTLLPALVVAAMTYYVLRQKTEPLIRESEARFSELFESAPDAMVIVDKLGKIILVNLMTEKIFGYSRDELIGEPVEKLIPPHLVEKHIVDRTAYVANKPKSRDMASGIDLYALRKDGSVFPVEIALSPSESSQGLLVTGVVRDITNRKKVEQEKKQLKERLGELVNNLPIGIYRYFQNNNGRLMEFNPAMLALFDADSDEQLRSHTITDLYYDIQEYQRFNAKLEKNGYLHNEEVNLKTLKGAEFVASITAVLKQDGKEGNFVDCIVEDISERKHNEQKIQQLNNTLRTHMDELEAINQELEAFSYSVSHDLRAPLRAIDGFSHILLSRYADKLDDTGKDRLDRIRAAAQRMGALIDDLLKLSRVSRVQLERETVDLSQIASEVVQELRHGEPERKVSFSIQPELSSLADRQLLRVVLDNLLGNAWKFTARRNDAEIEVGEQCNGEGCVFYVRDNGAGFDMRYVHKLFGAFQRLHDNSEFPGTGIGLATVQRVINKHGGRIWAESEVDKGTSFYFTLEQRGTL